MNLVSSALRRAAFPLVAVLLLGIGLHARADDGRAGGAGQSG